MLTSIDPLMLSSSSIVHVQVLFSSANILQTAGVALRVVFLLFLPCFIYYFAQFLLLKGVKCPSFLFSQPKKLNLVPRSSRFALTCTFDVTGSLNAKFFQIWSSVAGYGELWVCFQAIRIGDIFRMNNNCYLCIITNAI